jgi:hypothetical protein
MFESGMRSFPSNANELSSVSSNLSDVEFVAQKFDAMGETQAGYVVQIILDDRYRKSFLRRDPSARSISDIQLAEFNANVTGPFTAIRAFFGPLFLGWIPDRFGLKGKDAIAQFVALAGVCTFSRMDFTCEVQANNLAVFLNYPFWTSHDFSLRSISRQLRDQILQDILTIWSHAFPQMQLPCSKFLR